MFGHFRVTCVFQSNVVWQLNFSFVYFNFFWRGQREKALISFPRYEWPGDIYSKDHLIFCRSLLFLFFHRKLTLVIISSLNFRRVLSFLGKNYLFAQHVELLTFKNFPILYCVIQSSMMWQVKLRCSELMQHI